MSESTKTQLVVIGGGPGGYAAAFFAADSGLSVTLVDMEPNPGGVCLYRGCIPSKALLHVADVLNEARHAEAWGVTFGAPRIDVERLRAFKTKVVNQLTGGLGQLSKQRKITYSGGGLTPGDAERLALGRCNADRRARGTCQLRTTVCGDGRLDSTTARAP